MNTTLTRKLLLIKTPYSEIEITFSISENKYKKLIEVFEALTSGLCEFKYLK